MDAPGIQQATLDTVAEFFTSAGWLPYKVQGNWQVSQLCNHFNPSRTQYHLDQGDTSAFLDTILFGAGLRIHSHPVEEDMCHLQINARHGWISTHDGSATQIAARLQDVGRSHQTTTFVKTKPVESKMTPHILVYSFNRVLEKQRNATEHHLRTSELWQPILGLCSRPFGPLTSFATTGWQQTSDTRLTASFPVQTGVEMLVAWDQAGITQAFEYVGWRISSCKVDGFLHFAIESISNVSTPVSLIALTDILFLTYLRSLEVAAGITALHPQDTVLTKVKSVSGLNIWISLPTTTTFGIIHHAWSLAAAWTNVEPAVRLVVGAKQVMPHVAVLHLACAGRP